MIWQKRILASSGRSGFAGLSSAGSVEELRRKQEAFERLPSVAEVDSVLRVIPDEQQEKIGIVKSFAPVVAPVRIGRAGSVDLAAIETALADMKRRFDIVAAEAGPRLPAETKAVRDKTTALLNLLRRVKRESAEAALGYLQAQIYRDFIDKFHSLQRNLDPAPVTIEDVPPELRRKFVGESGRFLLQIHPRVDVWEREGARHFVSELRSVDADVTGPPVITYEALRLMERAYLQGTLYAFALVAALSLLMLRRLRETLLALLPLVVGLVWTLGLMHLFEVSFNLANIWGLPLIIGTSAEFGLNVMLRYLEGRAHGGPLLARSTVKAVALNGIIMMGGFGSLMIAAHRGVFGLGLLLTIGSACGALASLIVLPVLLKLLSRRAALDVDAVGHCSTA